MDLYLSDTYILLPFAVHKELGFYFKLTDMKTQVGQQSISSWIENTGSYFPEFQHVHV